MTQQRVDGLRARLKEENLDAVLISQPESRQYLSNFTGSAGFLFVSANKAILATDFRYTEQAGIQSPAFEVFRMTGAMDTWLPELVTSLSATKLAFEAEDMTVASHQRLSKALEKIEGKPPDLIPTESFIEPLRRLKDAEELASLQKAIDASDNAMNAITAVLRPGMTEREVGWKLEQAMRDNGADGPSFDTIVASGPNAAKPHHSPSDRELRTGEPIVIDMGAKVSGYCSDLTRTVHLGEADDMFRKIYDIVHSAQLAAIATVSEGLTGDETDALSRIIIEQAGYGDKFGHALGHGVGLAVHEAPRVGKGASDKIENDMVFTIEPGIYITGWGGVRIEDIVILENGKARLMSHANKNEILGVNA